MDGAAKMKYANTYIIPIIGIADYNKCNDLDKLKELLAKVSAA